jgi:predicted phosphodiesterase
MPGKLYTPKEEKKIRELNKKGFGPTEIATYFPEREPAGVKDKIKQMGLRVKTKEGVIKNPPKSTRESELEKEVFKLKRERGILQKHITDTKKRKAIEHHFSGRHAKIGIISDTHKGSLYDNQHLEDEIIKYFNKEKVDVVYHCGDLVDGEKMYKGHEYEIRIHGADAQVKNFVDNFPLIKSKGHFILGSHDSCYWKTDGHDIGKTIAEKRSDLEYLAQDQATIEIKPGVKIALIHPGGGTAYAVSYKSQKLVESFSGGEKPNIILCGHFHKFDHLFYRNIQAFQVPTTQSQTPFMKRKPTPAIMGGLVLDIWFDKKGITKLKSEYLPYYEKE